MLPPPLEFDVRWNLIDTQKLTSYTFTMKSNVLSIKCQCTPLPMTGSKITGREGNPHV
jgi:hypothetical protein